MSGPDVISPIQFMSPLGGIGMAADMVGGLLGGGGGEAEPEGGGGGGGGMMGDAKTALLGPVGGAIAGMVG
jgi:hypothetical protein